MAVEIQRPNDIQVVKETIVRKDSNNNDIIVSNVVEEKEKVKMNYSANNNQNINNNKMQNNIETTKHKKIINKSISQKLPLKITDEDFERKGSTRSLSCFINPELTVKDMVLSEEVTIDMYNQDPTYANVKKMKKKTDSVTTSSIDNDSAVLIVKSEKIANKTGVNLYDEKSTDSDQINSVEISKTTNVKESGNFANKGVTSVKETVYSTQYEDLAEENERKRETSGQLDSSNKRSLLKLVNASNDVKDGEGGGKNVKTTDNSFEVEHEILISSQTNTLERSDTKEGVSQLHHRDDDVQFKFKIPKEIDIQKQQKFTQPPKREFQSTSSEESPEIAKQVVMTKGKDVLKKVESFEAEIKNQNQKYQRKPRPKQKIVKRQSSSEYDLDLLDSDILSQSQLVRQQQHQLELLEQQNDLNEDDQVMRDILFKQFKEEQRKLSKQQLLKQHILRQQKRRQEEEEEVDPLYTEEHVQNFHNTLQRFNSKISEATTDDNVEVNEVKSSRSKCEYIRRYNTENLNFDGKVQNYVDNFENSNDDYVNVPKKVGKISTANLARAESNSLNREYVKIYNTEKVNYVGEVENDSEDYINVPSKHKHISNVIRVDSKSSNSFEIRNDKDNIYKNVSNNSYYENTRVPLGHGVTTTNGRVYGGSSTENHVNGHDGLVEEELIEKTIVVRGQKPQTSKHYTEQVITSRGQVEELSDLESRSLAKTNQHKEISFVKLSDFKKSGAEQKVTKHEKSKIYTLSNGSIEKNYDDEMNAVTNVSNVYKNNFELSNNQQENATMVNGFDRVDGRYSVKTENFAEHERFKPTEVSYTKIETFEDFPNETKQKAFISSKPKFTRQISPKVEEQKETLYTNYKQIVEDNIEERNKNLSPKMTIEDPMTTYKRTQVEYKMPDKEHYRKNITGRTEAARQKIERKSSNEQILHEITRDIDQYNTSQVTKFESSDSDEYYDHKPTVHVVKSYEKENYEINPETSFSNNAQRTYDYDEEADVDGIVKQTNYISSTYDDRFDARHIEPPSIYNIKVRNEDSLDRSVYKTRKVEEKHEIQEKPIRSFKNINTNDSITTETTVIKSNAENYYTPKDEVIKKEIKSNMSFEQRQLTKPFENNQTVVETIRKEPTVVYESYRSYGGGGSNEETSEFRKVETFERNEMPKTYSKTSTRYFEEPTSIKTTTTTKTSNYQSYPELKPVKKSSTKTIVEEEEEETVTQNEAPVEYVTEETTTYSGKISVDDKPKMEERIIEEKAIVGSISVEPRKREEEIKVMKGVISGVKHPKRPSPPPVPRKPSVLEVVAVNNNTTNYLRQQQQINSNNAAEVLARQISLNAEQQHLIQMQQQQEMDDLYKNSIEVTEELVGVNPDLTDAHKQGNKYKVTLNLTSLIAKTTRASSMLSRPISSCMVHSPVEQYTSPLQPNFVTSPREYSESRSNMYTPSVFESVTSNLSPPSNFQTTNYHNNYNNNKNNSIVVPISPNSQNNKQQITRNVSTDLGFELSLAGLNRPPNMTEETSQTIVHENIQRKPQVQQYISTKRSSEKIIEEEEEDEEEDQTALSGFQREEDVLVYKPSQIYVSDTENQTSSETRSNHTNNYSSNFYNYSNEYSSSSSNSYNNNNSNKSNEKSYQRSSLQQKITSWDVQKLLRGAHVDSVKQSIKVSRGTDRLETGSPVTERKLKHMTQDVYLDTEQGDIIAEEILMHLGDRKVTMTSKVTTEKRVPVWGSKNNYKISSLLLTRVIEVDLSVTEERRKLWDMIVGDEDRELNEHERKELYKKFMALAELSKKY